MFGDKLLAGQYSLLVDDKLRIAIPPDTDREKNDLIYVLYDEVMEHYTIYSKPAIENMFKLYEQAIVNASNAEELLFRKKEFLKFCKGILRQSSIDKQGRAVIGKICQPGDMINLIGCGDHFVLERRKK